MSNILEAYNLRKKYTHFRILVIGRANAGKTTLLKRVCNTTEEPCIYDENSNALLEPTAGRGHHDINRPFVFRSNPQFIFHDSIGFEAGDESMLKTVQDFITKHVEATDINEQLHAIWFCFTPDKARFLLELENRFFNEERCGNIPVIAVYTKFDDLITQVYDDHLDAQGNRKKAKSLLEDLQAPLFKSKFPPKTSVRVEDLHHDHGNHQKQVKELIRKTAASLDNLALRMLFTSVQQNNLHLCIEYAVEHTRLGSGKVDLREVVEDTLLWFRHSYYEDYEYEKTEKMPVQDDIRNNLRMSFSNNAQQHLRNGLQHNVHDFNQYRNQLKHFQNIRDVYIEHVTQVTFVMQKHNYSDKNSSFTELAALIICLEDSFWFKSSIDSGLFIEAFETSLKKYITTGLQKKVQKALKELGGPSQSSSQKSAFLQMILQHQLSTNNTHKKSSIFKFVEKVLQM